MVTSLLVLLPNPWLKLYLDLARSKWDAVFALILLLLEVVLCITIVYFIPYTEIDWTAYMEQVSQFQAGERNYYNIRGGTGPLVYPAGFLYLYSWLQRSGNKSIRTMQYIFIAIYIIQAAIVLCIYSLVARKYTDRLYLSLSKKKQDNDDNKNIVDVANSVWSWRIAMVLCCLSKRVHSIFMLRLFNDGPAMTLFYLSVLLFIVDKWNVGCVVYSMAVSIKMNILLFAPGLLLLLLQSQTSWMGTLQCLCICATVQILVGWPFLTTYPVAYVRKSFELDRVFMYKWTVNWKLLDEDIFVSKKLSLLLLALHLCFLAVFAMKFLRACKNQTGKYCFLWNSSSGHRRLSAEYITWTLFVSNMIGIIFARTLHYQFYSWYFHTLPMLLWQANVQPWLGRLVLLVLIEYAFNVFPATAASSLALQIAHFAILGVLLATSSTPPILAPK